jgi:hypothetical protein
VAGRRDGGSLPRSGDGLVEVLGPASLPQQDSEVVEMSGPVRVTGRRGPQSCAGRADHLVQVAGPRSGIRRFPRQGTHGDLGSQGSGEVALAHGPMGVVAACCGDCQPRELDRFGDVVTPPDEHGPDLERSTEAVQPGRQLQVPRRCRADGHPAEVHGLVDVGPLPYLLETKAEKAAQICHDHEGFFARRPGQRFAGRVTASSR